MPYYDLYKEYIDKQVDAGFKRDKYKDYEHYSIGFLTRKCFRHCPFCVNKLEDGVVSYSKLEWFHDKKRPHVYFWDDNFLGAPYHIWKAQLQYLIDNKISFQFCHYIYPKPFCFNQVLQSCAQCGKRSRPYRVSALRCKGRGR